jgi:hypothetical protein
MKMCRRSSFQSPGYLRVLVGVLAVSVQVQASPLPSPRSPQDPVLQAEYTLAKQLSNPQYEVDLEAAVYALQHHQGESEAFKRLKNDFKAAHISKEVLQTIAASTAYHPQSKS